VNNLEAAVNPVSAVATVVAPAPSGSLAPVGDQPPVDFMDTGEPEPPVALPAAAPVENSQTPMAVEATGLYYFLPCTITIDFIRVNITVCLVFKS